MTLQPSDEHRHVDAEHLGEAEQRGQPRVYLAALETLVMAQAEVGALGDVHLRETGVVAELAASLGESLARPGAESLHRDVLPGGASSGYARYDHARSGSGRNVNYSACNASGGEARPIHARKE